MLIQKNWGEKNMHSIRTDFGFNLLRSASKLKRRVFEKKLVGAFGFPYSWIFLPPIFLLFFFAVNRDGDIVRESFSVIFILHSLWYTPLVYVFMNLFSNVIFCVCSLLFFFLSTRCQYYMNYWTHSPFNCWQNRSD